MSLPRHPSMCAATRFVFLFVLFGTIVIFGQPVNAQDPIYISDRTAAAPPERVEIQTGKYKLLKRNAKGQIFQEDVYETSGSLLLQVNHLVETREITSMYPNWQRGAVTVHHFEQEETGPKMIETETEVIQYNADGTKRRTDVTRFDSKGTVIERADYPGDRSSAKIRNFKPAGAAGRLQILNKDGKWENLPGQPQVPTDPKSVSQAPITPAGEASVRRRANGDQSLLMSFTAEQVDNVQVKLPGNFEYSIGFLPRGWNVTQDGRNLTFTGPAADQVNFRIDSKENFIKNLPGKKIEWKASRDKRTISSLNTPVTLAPDVKVGSIDGALTLRNDIQPGTPFLATADERYKNGEWQIGSEIPLELRESIISFLHLPEVEKPQDKISYRDEFGEETLFDDGQGYFLFNPGRRIGLEVDDLRKNYAFAGQTTCVGGSFQPMHWFSITLNNKVSLWPVAASVNSVLVGIPADIPPGQHTINSIMGDQVVNVLGVEGSIDQNKLRTGQATTMKLRVVGTDEPLPLKIENKTPNIINLEGGVVQFVKSSGGADNSIVRSVTGTNQGNFNIDYSLNIDQCRSSKKPN